MIKCKNKIKKETLLTLVLLAITILMWVYVAQLSKVTVVQSEEVVLPLVELRAKEYENNYSLNGTQQAVLKDEDKIVIIDIDMDTYAYLNSGKKEFKTYRMVTKYLDKYYDTYRIAEKYEDSNKVKHRDRSKYNLYKTEVIKVDILAKTYKTVAGYMGGGGSYLVHYIDRETGIITMQDIISTNTKEGDTVYCIRKTYTREGYKDFYTYDINTASVEIN